ncbi:SDR family oxidoreductase [Streptomyces sp. 549]|uniref:SDR family oxidoreductase n=1 Tax=Streptomyces sp. 549 TaxID=3049076 RepID=UPI0024C29571|nr:SDR family oxidoreductase [Streptomyces sp. 549]MDK1476765.1 SDR family oxidoreductase [Streptomyces sp. 549]
MTEHAHPTQDGPGDTSDGPRRPLAGKVVLVAGATRGAGRAMAVELGRAGATVYATGRTTRDRLSEVGRAGETIEQTAELVDEAGGTGIAVVVDHLDPEQVAGLAERIDREQGRLDVLVNDIWGGDHLLVFHKPLWELDLEANLRMLRLGIDSHVITSHRMLPLLIRRPGALVIEVTDGTADSNREYRESFCYDVAKYAPIRMAKALAAELKPHGGHAVCVSPGFLRSEQMLDAFGVTEENWRDAVAKEPTFAIAESPLFLGRCVAALAADTDVARWNGQSVDSGQLAREYGVKDADGSQPDAWRYLKEVMSGREVDVADYR